MLKLSKEKIEQREEDMRFIKSFSDITLKDIFDSLGICQSNFYSTTQKKVSTEKVHQVRLMLEEKIQKLINK